MVRLAGIVAVVVVMAVVEVVMVEVVVIVDVPLQPKILVNKVTHTSNRGINLAALFFIIFPILKVNLWNHPGDEWLD